MSQRKARMEADIQQVVDFVTAENWSFFRDFNFEENLFSFTYAEKEEEKHYTMQLSDDYPANTFVNCSDCQHQPEIVSETIPLIFNRIAQAVLLKVADNHKEDVGRQAGRDAAIPGNQHVKEAAVPNNSDDSKPGCIPNNQESKEEEGENASCHIDSSTSEEEEDIHSYDDEEDDDDDDDFMNYYEEDEELCEFNCESPKTNPLLMEHIEKVKEIFGEKSISFRTFSAIDVIDVDLHIDVSFLQPGIAHAWKVRRNEDITIRMQMSFSKYLEYSEPRIEVFQLVNKEREKFGLGSQIKKITEVFMSNHWRWWCQHSQHSTGHSPHLAPEGGPGQSQPSRPPGLDPNIRSRQSGDCWQPWGEAATATSLGSGSIPSSGSLGSAGTPSSNAGSGVDGTPSPTSTPSHTNSTPSTTSAKKIRSKLFSKLKVGSETLSGQEKLCEENLHLLPFSTEIGKNSKEVPGAAHGFLVQLLTYIERRIPTLNEYCVVCDEPHVFQNGAMLKPAVCGRELCVFAFNTLGVMQDAAECVASGAEVVDLLVSMAISAVGSPRRDLVFDPYPIVVDPDNPKEFILNPKKKDFSRIEKSLDKFITTREMTEAANTREMKQKMDQIDPLAFPLLSWIVSSNRSHIVKLPEHRQLKFMYTPHQFLLLSSPPAKEAEFGAARDEHGSVFAFHGSHIENWHSIMRRGLFNASSTKLKLHGAAYGAGIYLSPSFQLAFSYSAKGHSFKKVISVQVGPTPSLKANVVKPAEKTKRKIKDVAAHTHPPAPKATSNNHRFLKTKNLTCIALCEVINSASLKKHGNIWVMPDSNLVCTRFFFVYEDGQIGDMGVDTCQDKYFKEIKRVIEDQKKS